ncbi:MAG: hypothetical protein Q9191_003128 [Dirinaria sp. TL-2023a]
MSNGDRDKDGSASGNSSSRPSSRSQNNASNRGVPSPHYMTVGSGSTSASAAALMASLDRDSGYGTSIASSDCSGQIPIPSWHPHATEDNPIPTHIPTLPGEYNPAAENARAVYASHIHQLAFNQHRVTLGRAITRTVETLVDFKVENAKWPAQYPPVQARESLSARSDPRPGIVHTQSTASGDFHHPTDAAVLRPGPRRAGTSLGERTTGEPSAAAQKSSQETARLITPQAAQEFSILKLDLRVQGLTQAEIAHSTDRKTIASLLDGMINQSIRHLQLLKTRIEDTSSKVLVTGDLNAGKSTFCNALLRRKVLPEDQQPCTSIFCEVLDARENGGIEEAHAVHKDALYNRNDESTYDVYPLHELEKVVTDNKDYTQCKVYVKDSRSINESLLNNGIVDISIIDAPGLNSDSLKTTAVFARQEEIDVVVFVVNAANHFTLSAKEFLWNAAMEKAYLFIVVNGFDTIRDKERCERMILEQIATLSPRTFKESSELVHFVSSNAIPVAPAIGPGSPGRNGGSSGGGANGSSSDPDKDPSNDEDGPIGKHGEPGSPPRKDKGKDKEKLQDFEHLEGALRRFVLEKRARSKLAPARTYLLNILTDLNVLATFNQDIAQSELDRVSAELDELEPVYEQSKKARSEVSDGIDKTIEETCGDIYSHTRCTLNTAIARVAEADLGVPYSGLFNAFDYADRIKAAMLDQISAAVMGCEEEARSRAVAGVNTIKSLGILHLGNAYTDLSFRSDILFRRKRDALARQVDTEVEIWDFFDIGGLWERQEKVAGTSMVLTVAGVLGGRMMGGVGWIDGALGAAKIMGSQNLRKLIVPGIIATGAVLLASAYALHSIPNVLPSRLASRLRSTLEEIDYTHTNSLRISSEVRKVFKIPAEELRDGLQENFVQLSERRAETLKVKGESEVARRYFGNLLRESAEGKRSVEDIDLEGGPGVLGGYGEEEILV